MGFESEVTKDIDDIAENTSQTKLILAFKTALNIVSDFNTLLLNTIQTAIGSPSDTANTDSTSVTSSLFAWVKSIPVFLRDSLQGKIAAGVNSAKNIVLAFGTATGGSNTTIAIESTKKPADNLYAGKYFEVMSAATGTTYSGLITSNTETTITVPALSGAYAVVSGDTYVIKENPANTGALDRTTDSVSTYNAGIIRKSIQNIASAITAGATSAEINLSAARGGIFYGKTTSSKEWRFKIQGAYETAGTYSDFYVAGVLQEFTFTTGYSVYIANLPPFIKVVSTENADGGAFTLDIEPTV